MELKIDPKIKPDNQGNVVVTHKNVNGTYQIMFYEASIECEQRWGDAGRRIEKNRKRREHVEELVNKKIKSVFEIGREIELDTNIKIRRIM
jgi:hypothetical protein